MAQNDTATAAVAKSSPERGKPRSVANDLTRWHRFQMGGHPDYAADNSLDIHVIWCVWHEGLPYYRNGTSMPIDEFRQACVEYQRHNGVAKSMIQNATNNELYAVLNTMSDYFDHQENGGYNMLYFHMVWVLHHEGQRRHVLELLDQGKFDEIRDVYRSEQSHNPHVHHLIEAARDTTIRDLVDSMK